MVAAIGTIARPAAANWTGSLFTFAPLPGCQIFSNSASQAGPRIEVNVSHPHQGSVNVMIEAEFFDGNRRVDGGRSQMTMVGPNQVLGIPTVTVTRGRSAALSRLRLDVRVIACTPA